MSDFIKEDASYFEGFDFDNAKPIKHPLIAQAQARAKVSKEKDELSNFFDDDVQEAIRQHNTPSNRKRVNEMIRLLFETA